MLYITVSLFSNDGFNDYAWYNIWYIIVMGGNQNSQNNFLTKQMCFTVEIISFASSIEKTSRPKLISCVCAAPRQCTHNTFSPHVTSQNQFLTRIFPTRPLCIFPTRYCKAVCELRKKTVSSDINLPCVGWTLQYFPKTLNFICYSRRVIWL